MIENQENTNQDNAQTQPNRDYFLPASILIAALLVSGSLVWSAGKRATVSDLQGNLGASVNNNVGATGSVTLRPFSSDDHVFGNPDALVKVVEFSDLECPFCKQFHSTMQKIIADYKGQVAWVYRHFPIDELHPKSRNEASASECANEIGGNQKFWDYVNRIFEITPSNNGLDPAELPKVALEIGLDKAKFASCLASGRYADKVSKDISDALGAGARGTPYSVVLGKKGKQYVINGALPYAEVKAIIDRALE